MLQVLGLAAVFWAVWSIAGTALFLGAFGVFALLVGLALERLRRNAFTKEQNNKLKEHKNKLMSAIGGNNFNGVNLFEGTTPAAASATPHEQATPMSGQAPSDAGVDISDLFGTVGKSWNAHMTNVQEGK